MLCNVASSLSFKRIYLITNAKKRRNGNSQTFNTQRTWYTSHSWKIDTWSPLTPAKTRKISCRLRKVTQSPIRLLLGHPTRSHRAPSDLRSLLNSLYVLVSLSSGLNKNTPQIKVSAYGDRPLHLYPD